MLYGQPIQPINPDPFIQSLIQGEQKVAVGIDSTGNEVVLFGIEAAYPMQDGGNSIGLVAALPLEYITGFLSLADENQLMYYHIIRPDGSFVIQNPNTELLDFFEQLQNQPAAVTDKSFAKNTIEDFGLALRAHKEYAAILEINDEARQIYGTPLPYSEWYLVAVMPYSAVSYTHLTLPTNSLV